MWFGERKGKKERKEEKKKQNCSSNPHFFTVQRKSSHRSLISTSGNVHLSLVTPNLSSPSLFIFSNLGLKKKCQTGVCKSSLGSERERASIGKRSARAARQLLTAQTRIKAVYTHPDFKRKAQLGVDLTLVSCANLLGWPFKFSNYPHRNNWTFTLLLLHGHSDPGSLYVHMNARVHAWNACTCANGVFTSEKVWLLIKLRRRVLKLLIVNGGGRQGRG